MAKNVPSLVGGRTKVIVATSVMLSFISFWRAAAIVLNDLGSSAYYVGGIAEQAVGRSAPWFILGVMLFSYAVRSVYVESCAMFTRGGVYRVVKEAMGGTLAKLSVSALMFDYILTGPISGVSAGQYIVGLVAQTSTYFGYPLDPSPDTINYFAAGIAALITVYFWWRNTKGIHESSDDALKIMYVTTAMVVLLIAWCSFTILTKPASQRLPPAPVTRNMTFSDDAVGWMPRLMPNYLRKVPAEQSSALNQELNATDTSSSGGATTESAPHYSFVPNAGALLGLIGILMAFGAINTSIIGSNGVLNRVSEDGVMTDWFRAPHKRFGTTYRMINLIVILQLVAIIGSRGNTYTLGEAYAFGVIWSFAFKGLAMLVLRFKDKSDREWKVPFNIQLGGNEIPLGLGAIAAILFSIAGINLITKQVATVSGVAFTLVFFSIFLISERINERKRGQAAHVEMDQFRLQPQEIISNETVEVRPGNALCLVRDYNTLAHLQKALEATHTGKRDLVVMTVQVMKGPDAGYEDIGQQHLFTNYEQLLFSRVTSLAEKAGKHVDLLIVPGAIVFDAIAQTAAHLDSADIWSGRSSVMTAEEQAKRIGEAWERLPNKPKRQVCFHVVEPDHQVDDFDIGAHAPKLADEDVNLIHKLWLDVTQERGLDDLHHKEIVTTALANLEEQMNSKGREAILDRMRALIDKRSRKEQ